MIPKTVGRCQAPGISTGIIGSIGKKYFRNIIQNSVEWLMEGIRDWTGFWNRNPKTMESETDCICKRPTGNSSGIAATE